MCFEHVFVYYQAWLCTDCRLLGLYCFGTYGKNQVQGTSIKSHAWLLMHVPRIHLPLTFYSRSRMYIVLPLEPDFKDVQYKLPTKTGTIGNFT